MWRSNFFQKFRGKKGVSLIEIIIVISIITTLLSLVFVSVLNVNSTDTINTSFTTLITDLKNQQIKAMAGDTEGRGTPEDYGIYIGTNNYTLFHGNTYSSSDPSNFDVAIQNPLRFTSTLPLNQIVFSSGSGELRNFETGQNRISLTDTSTSQTKLIEINKYGVITTTN